MIINLLKESNTFNNKLSLNIKIHYVQIWKMTLHTTSFSLKIDLKGSAVNMDLVPSTHRVVYTYITLVFPGIGCLLLAIMSTRHTHGTHIHIQAKHSCTENSKFLKLLLFVCVCVGPTTWVSGFVESTASSGPSNQLQTCFNTYNNQGITLECQYVIFFY